MDTNTAENPAAATDQAPATNNENVMVFDIPNTDTKMQIDIAQVPAELRMDFLKKGLENYVRNSVNQANVRHKKAMEPWAAYAKANEADPNQTAVPKPEGDEPEVDLIKTATDARERLYNNDVRKQGTGTAKRKTDPLTKMVTDAVLRELFDKKRETNSSYKWTDAVKEVGGNGIEYLDKLIADKVAAGADEAELNKYKETKYIQPAKLMLGQRDTKVTGATDLFA